MAPNQRVAYNDLARPAYMQPRSVDGKPVTDDPRLIYLDALAQRLNSRPRKTLGYATLADRLANTLLH